MQNTRISYSYIDAHQQVVQQSRVLEGSLSDEDGELIGRKLHDRAFFIPAQVGLESLQALTGRAPDENDVIWHRWDFDAITPTMDEPDVDLSCQDLVENFGNVIWDQLSATAELYGQPVKRPRMRMM